MGEEDDTVDGCAADMRGQRAVAASEADGCAGVGDTLGRLVGRALALGRQEGLKGQLGWLADAGRAAGWKAYFFFSFFYFSFLFHCLNSNLV